MAASPSVCSSAGLGVHHPHLHRPELGVRPHVVPEVGVVGDRLALLHEVDSPCPVLPVRRSAAGSPRAGRRGRSGCARRAARSAGRARRASWPTAPAAAAGARACRWPRGSPCPGRPRPRARGCRRSAPGGPRTGGPRSGRGSAAATRSAGPPTSRTDGCPRPPIVRPRWAATAATSRRRASQLAAGLVHARRTEWWRSRTPTPSARA